MRAGVRSNLQIHREALAEKYLGLPTATGRIMGQNFIHYREQARSRVQGYCEKLMSCAAKLVLLKAFKLTKGLCQKVTTVMSKDGSLTRGECTCSHGRRCRYQRRRAGLAF